MQRKRRRRRRRVSAAGVVLLVVMGLIIIAGIWGIIWLLTDSGSGKKKPEPVTYIETTPTTEPTTEPPTEPPPPVSYPERGASIIQPGTGLDSEYAILVDYDNNTVIAEKSSQTRIYPASMTKLMTLIVAIEHIDNYSETFTMTDEIIAPLYEAHASLAGFKSQEECTMMDLLYGTALSSGADATTALAIHVAGSEEAFVKLMNEKVQELGLTDTHFMNASGLHDENHYSTVTDIALIMDYCLQNPLCKRVISTYTYTTRVTPQSPEGIKLVSTMFSRMYGTEVEGITILGGKTGFTDEAGQCLASYAQTLDGRTYIAVTAGGQTKWRPIFDAFKIYGIITGTYPMDATDVHTEETENAPTENRQVQ
ncbi:MAG: D-alanyl-D-alanine carboxypeptidase [Oscillospiraceae bacterium]|nr:D-alanyl-D-alanine carboxypeptidase [Oscillospiraceae bacterium]